MNRFAVVLIALGLLAVALFVVDPALVDEAALPTLSFGFLLLTAYLTGDLLSGIGLPRITGYILAGVAFGPHALALVSAETVDQLKLIDQLALTFIALAAGAELRLSELRARRRSIALTVLLLTVIVFLGVAAVVFAAPSLFPFLDGRPLSSLIVAAALLGVFANARSPASAIAIISEVKARGPFTETVLGVTVIMDVKVILIFAAVVSVGVALTEPDGALDVVFLLLVAGELVASIAAGFALAWLISLYIRKVRVEIGPFILAAAFAVTFASSRFAAFLDQVHDVSFHLEPMLVCMTAGFAVRNFYPGGARLLEQIERSSLVIYVLFFSLVGAALDIRVLRTAWAAAITIVTVRGILVWLGVWLAARLSGDPPRFGRTGGLGYLTQAGVSLGLAGIVMDRFPGWGPALATTIVAVIIINQVIGPVALKYALTAAGECRSASGRRPEEVEDG